MSDRARPKEVKILDIERLPYIGDKPVLQDASLVFEQAIKACNNFYAQFQQRGQDDEDASDLLRAMLVFSCSGLDAAVKQLIQDALPCIIDKDEGARKEFEKFVERRFKRGSQSDDRDRANPSIQLDAGFLASILVTNNPRGALINSLTESLTNDSLQSRDQLLRVAAAFAITKEEVIKKDDFAREAFKARNEIVHEMDIDISHEKRRRERRPDDVARWSAEILSICSRFISCVGNKISKPVNAANEAVVSDQEELELVRPASRETE
jgi:hypothetical protein